MPLSKNSTRTRLSQLLVKFVADFDHLMDEAQEPLQAELMAQLNAIRVDAAVLADQLHMLNDHKSR